MCEFKVFLRDDNGLRMIAEDIVFVKLHGSKLVLQDVIGQEVQLKSAIVSEVNVPKERLELFSNPLIGKVLNFVEKYAECIRTNTYNEELEEIWEEIKAEGSEMIRTLWMKLKG